MITRLTLLCHAATAANRAASFPADEPIDAREPARAALLRPRLAGAGTAWTSPETRSRQTAEAVGLAATVAPDLRDCDYGTWAGRPLGDVQREDPAGVAAWIGDPSAAPHGGESVTDLLRRVALWLDGIHGLGPVVAVTHATIIRAAIVHAVGAPPSAFWRFDITPLSLTDLRHADNRWTVRATGCALAE